MLRKALHSKVHLATVTAALPEYIGSVTIDAAILDAIGLRVNDAIEVANQRNGARFDTYVFLGDRGSGRIEVNGAAAHLVEPGDRLIIMHYALMTDAEYAAHSPRVAIMGPRNQIEKVIRYEPRP